MEEVTINQVARWSGTSAIRLGDFEFCSANLPLPLPPPAPQPPNFPAFAASFTLFVFICFDRQWLASKEGIYYA
jgi:hypothetical protein